MDKKIILSNATKELKAKKTTGAGSVLDWFGRRISAAWKWLCGAKGMVFFNIVLLALICGMFFVMLGRVGAPRARRPMEPGFAAASRPVYDLEERLRLRDRPTIVVARNGVPMVAIPRPAGRPRPARPNPAPKIERRAAITLPIRPGAPAPDVPAIRKTLQGHIVVDGRGRNIKMSSMTTVNGDLYIQNLRTYTLPCGTRVNGNLFLRNVALLKFCGCFDVRGNIYVSADSSFGPIPRDAFLGGRVIF